MPVSCLNSRANFFTLSFIQIYWLFIICWHKIKEICLTSDLNLFRFKSKIMNRDLVFIHTFTERKTNIKCKKGWLIR